jgi:sugar lactone lactonase YvrE
LTVIDGFTLDRSDLEAFAFGLARPECVLPEPDGSLWVSDQRGALSHVQPDGTVRTIGSMGGAPNGFARDPDGLFWIADIEGGRVCRMDTLGRHEVVIDRYQGKPIGSANFLMADPAGDLWLSVSTRTLPRSRALAEPVPDGAVYRIKRLGTQAWAEPVCVASGFHFTNEIRLAPDRSALLVAETALGRVTRIDVDQGGLPAGSARPYGPAPVFPEAHVDGIVFDSDGNLWVTEIRRNALLVITPQGRSHVVFEDPEGTAIRKPTSLCFAGPDLRTVIVGSLVDDHLKRFRSPVPGCTPVHWSWYGGRPTS